MSLITSLMSGSIEGIVESFAGLIKSRGDTLKSRKYVRQQIIAPVVSELHKREVAEQVAQDIIDYLFVPGRDGWTLMMALAWKLLDMTVMEAKKRLLVKQILRHAEDIQQFTEVVRDRDDLTFKFVRGKDDMEDFVRDLLSVIGG